MQITLIILAMLVASSYSAINPPGCGNAPNAPSSGRRDISDRIVGGTEAKANSWPWQTGLKSGNSLICGGSIVDNRFILTAAHCVSMTTAITSYSIIVGHHSRAGTESTAQTRNIDFRLNHPSYNSNTYDNDISLLRVSSILTFNSQVGPVCFTSTGTYDNGNQIAWATGHGTLSSGGSNPTNLQQVDLTVITQTQCRTAYSTSQIRDSMICAGTGSGKDTCQGDSGGPLVVKVGNLWYQIGATSWGTGCAIKPGVYCRVQSFYNWISSTINANTPSG